MSGPREPEEAGRPDAAADAADVRWPSEWGRLISLYNGSSASSAAKGDTVSAQQIKNNQINDIDTIKSIEINLKRNPLISQMRWYEWVINLIEGGLTVTLQQQLSYQSIITWIFHDGSVLLDGRKRRMRSRSRSTFRQTVPIRFRFVAMFNLTNHSSFRSHWPPPKNALHTRNVRLCYGSRTHPLSWRRITGQLCFPTPTFTARVFIRFTSVGPIDSLIHLCATPGINSDLNVVQVSDSFESPNNSYFMLIKNSE